MRISDKLLKKYAVGTPILPPKPEKEVEIVVPKQSDEIPREWIELEEFDPLTERPVQSPEELLEEVREEPLGGDTPVEEIGGDMPTVRPGKKANLSADTLLKMCSKYHDLCNKF